MKKYFKPLINKIHCADCIEFMKQLPDNCIDLVLTDPPYILNLDGGKPKGDFSNRKLISEKHISFISNDYDFEGCCNEWIRICKKVNLYIFCSNAQISRTMNFFEKKGYMTTLLVWDKLNPIPLCNNKYVGNLEFIVCVRDKGSFLNNKLQSEKKFKTFRYSAPSERIHPTEKPLSLIKDLINLKSKPGDIILDCFSGSGVVAIGASDMDRNFICVERNKDYCKSSINRFHEHNGLFQNAEGGN